MRCGRLGVGRYPLHSLVAPLAAGAGSQRVFVVAAISQGLIEPQQIPPDRLHTDSPAAHLPYPHRLVSVPWCNQQRRLRRRGPQPVCERPTAPFIRARRRSQPFPPATRRHYRHIASMCRRRTNAPANRRSADSASRIIRPLALTTYARTVQGRVDAGLVFHCRRWRCKNSPSSPSS
jgi:hypothetical protein